MLAATITVAVVYGRTRVRLPDPSSLLFTSGSITWHCAADFSPFLQFHYSWLNKPAPDKKRCIHMYIHTYTHTSLRKLHGRQSKENRGLSVNHSTEKLPIPKKERGHGVFHSFPNSKIIPLAVSDWRFRMSHGEEH